MGRRDGFTLIELLIVIGIFGIIISFSAPTLASLRTNLLTEARAQALASEIRRAQCLDTSRFPRPGSAGTTIIGRKRVIVSPLGRVRIE